MSMEELEAVKAEADRLRRKLAAAEVKLHAMSHEYRAEAPKTVAAAVSRHGDHTLVEGCVHALKEDARLTREENAKLLEVQFVLREENNVLRDLMKKAMAAAMPASAATTAAVPVAVTAAVKLLGVETAAMKSLDVETTVVKVPEVKLKEAHDMNKPNVLVQYVEKAPYILWLDEGKIKPKLSAEEGSGDPGF